MDHDVFVRLIILPTSVSFMIRSSPFTHKQTYSLVFVTGASLLRLGFNVATRVQHFRSNWSKYPRSKPTGPRFWTLRAPRYPRGARGLTGLEKFGQMGYPLDSYSCWFVTSHFWPQRVSICTCILLIENLGLSAETCGNQTVRSTPSFRRVTFWPDHIHELSVDANLLRAPMVQTKRCSIILSDISRKYLRIGRI